MADPTRKARRIRSALGLAVLGLFAACGDGGLPAPTHGWSLSLASQQALEGRPDDRVRVEAVLEAAFGSPVAPDARPLADGTDPDRLGYGDLSERLARAVRVDNRRRFIDAIEPLEAGDLERARRELPSFVAPSGELTVAALEQWLPSPLRASSQFTRSCLVCHGPEGGGNGPSAASLKAIPPRDYRSGAFVHFPDHLRPRPSREDLVDVLHSGVVGTSMQSFKSLPSSELVGLAEHVRRLAARGAFEQALVAAVVEGQALDDARIESLYAAAWAPWLAAEQSTDQ
ncbi:MAG: hypothetical protein AAFZ65_01770 [Planctomycetota bacterium]